MVWWGWLVVSSALQLGRGPPFAPLAFSTRRRSSVLVFPFFSGPFCLLPLSPLPQGHFSQVFFHRCCSPGDPQPFVVWIFFLHGLAGFLDFLLVCLHALLHLQLLLQLLNELFGHPLQDGRHVAGDVAGGRL
jgi:hypothetical protein